MTQLVLYVLLCGFVLAAPVNGGQDEPAMGEQEEAAMRSYLGLLFQKLESHNHYPREAERNGLNGRVVLRFTVRRDGSVLNPEVIEVEGHDSFRRAALQALMRVGKLPPFPSDIRRPELLVDIPMTYRIAEAVAGQEPAARPDEVPARDAEVLAQRQSAEIWQCFAVSDAFQSTVLVTLAHRGGGPGATGTITSANVTYEAWFRLAGLERRWNFGLDEHTGGFTYAFVIQPDGTGLYYDFTEADEGEKVGASDRFKCAVSK